jgi:hypothetical protein
MIKMKSLLSEDLKRISLQDALDRKLFGPVYHGTSQDNLGKIDREGFRIVTGLYGTAGMTQGYQPGTPYQGDIPAPIHHLGFGVYFTTVKAIAKRFAGGTAKGMKAYFLDAPRMGEINFGATHTMMKWWIKNGYDPELAKQGEGGRYYATLKLTEELKSKHDAVWFKGKGIHRLLDGDQVCVYDPNNIYVMDKSLIKAGEIGSKVVAKFDLDPYGRGEIVVPKGTIGIINDKEIPNELQKWAEGSTYVYKVKFIKGGNQYNLTDKQIEPYVGK